MGRKGFTIVELVVSLVIISILMAGVLPTVGLFKSAKDMEKDLIKAGDEVSVKLGVSVFHILYERLPESLGELLSSGIVIGDPEDYELLYNEKGVPVLR